MGTVLEQGHLAEELARSDGGDLGFTIPWADEDADTAREDDVEAFSGGAFGEHDGARGPVQVHRDAHDLKQVPVVEGRKAGDAAQRLYQAVAYLLLYPHALILATDPFPELIYSGAENVAFHLTRPPCPDLRHPLRRDHLRPQADAVDHRPSQHHGAGPGRRGRGPDRRRLRVGVRGGGRLAPANRQ